MLNVRMISWRPLAAAAILAVATVAAIGLLLAGTASADQPPQQPPFCIAVGDGPADFDPPECRDSDERVPPEVIMDGVVLN